MLLNSGELLFIKSVKDGIPNRDPLNDSDARRLFPEEDGRISLSDVSIKRDVRDGILVMESNGGADQRNHIFVQEVMNENGKLLGRGSLADRIAKLTGKEQEAKKDMKCVLLDHCFDARTFGLVYSVKSQNFHLTGPVQFGWSHSLHPVDTQYVQGTVVIPSQDVSGKESSAGEGEEGKRQGTIWSTYTLPFAVFGMYGIINAHLAEKSRMTWEDQELLLKALWQGTLNRQARGRGQQQPLLLVHIEYKNPMDRIGYLDEFVRLLPEETQWREEGKRPSSVRDIQLDLAPLVEILQTYEKKIESVRIWKHPQAQVIGNVESYLQDLW